MGTCELCGEQIVWDDGDWITLDGKATRPRGSEHRPAAAPGSDYLACPPWRTAESTEISCRGMSARLTGRKSAPVGGDLFSSHGVNDDGRRDEPACRS